MATRSCIIVKVRNSDIGTTQKYSDEKSKAPANDWGGNCVDKCEDVKIEKPYMGVYCHWDGYPSGVGASLKVFADTYERALNLVLGGSISSINEDDFTHYANRDGETWSHIEPIQGDTAIDVNAEVNEDYAYLFDEDNGGWKVLNIETNEFEGY
jgi:hypothetical protein